MGKHRSVGLALGERHIAAARVVASGRRVAVEHAAELSLPEDVTWGDPAAVGRVLGEFLRRSGMGGSLVVGLPSRWLGTASIAVPPATRQQLAAILRLDAEKAFSPSPGAAACDYSSAPPAGQSGRALLVGVTKERLSAVLAAVRAARVKARAVTSTGCALGLAGSGDGAAVVAAGTPDGFEVVRLRDGQVDALRHVPGGSGGALRLALNAVRTGGAGDASVKLWGCGESVRAACEEDTGPGGPGAAQELELPVEGLAEASLAAGVMVERMGPAVALAMAGQDARLLAVDFLHSRLAARRRLRWSRPAAWGAALGATAVIAVVVTLTGRSARREDLAMMRERLAQMEPSIAAAQELVDRVTLARGWYDRRPANLDCLLALTLSFPEEGSVWATSLAIREDMQGLLSGKARDERSVLQVLDAMKGSQGFADTKLVFIRESRGAAGDTAFAIEFTYVGEG